MDVRDRRGEQLLTRVAEHRAGGLVGGDDPVLERVDEEHRVVRSLEGLLEQLVAAHAAYSSSAATAGTPTLSSPAASAAPSVSRVASACSGGTPAGMRSSTWLR
jgi:hypothetical protein